jgi:hypothetical protein
MYPGLPSRLEKEIRALYFEKVAKGNKAQLEVQSSILSLSPTHSHSH